MLPVEHPAAPAEVLQDVLLGSQHGLARQRLRQVDVPVAREVGPELRRVAGREDGGGGAERLERAAGT